ncbi:hypothetical protein LRS10_06605 [Phenylobacterium sp. J426]|uniref:hypothetical protein n=1 Tax=Phenylobacterium sp. J426 TaxID=2898439 RepID=UPI002151BF12|nr:hypothetical protein [Phenylobacterium sp. J426]MCR5873875.1 hypothetical protein [Phenylobacterium sp. J426]
MTWSMPRPALQLVAVLIGAAALGAFSLGVITADAPARLPGERGAGAGDQGQAIEAQEATPLDQERIEGPPPPPELTPEEKAKQEEARKAREEAARLKAEADAAAAPNGQASSDPLGDVLQKAQPRAAPQPAQPPPDEPLF